MKFRKKPVVIEAIQWNGKNLKEIKEFVGKSLEYAIKDGPFVVMVINTLEGAMHISEKDWIIKGVEGEFYPCKPGIFEKTYEKVDDNA